MRFPVYLLCAFLLFSYNGYVFPQTNQVDHTGKLFSLDFEDRAKSWDFTVRSWKLDDAEVVLNWANIDEIDADYSFILEDVESGEIIDLRNVNEFRFTSNSTSGIQNSKSALPDETFCPEWTGNEDMICAASSQSERHFRLTVTKDESGSILPDEFGIAEVYPNPFNSEIRIGFNLVSEGSVTLKVFDLQGREIAVIGQGQYVAGSHQLMWDASEFSSGVYMVKLEAGSDVSTRKVVLMR